MKGQHTMSAGVYILKRGDVPVYVGRSKNMEHRVAQHIDKQFTSIEFRAMPPDKISESERSLIASLRPEYNKYGARHCPHYNFPSQHCRGRGLSLPPSLMAAAIAKAQRMDISFSKYIKRLIRVDMETGVLKEHAL